MTGAGTVGLHLCHVATIMTWQSARCGWCHLRLVAPCGCVGSCLEPGHPVCDVLCSREELSECLRRSEADCIQVLRNPARTNWTQTLITSTQYSIHDG